MSQLNRKISENQRSGSFRSWTTQLLLSAVGQTHHELSLHGRWGQMRATTYFNNFRKCVNLGQAFLACKLLPVTQTELNLLSKSQERWGCWRQMALSLSQAQCHFDDFSDQHRFLSMFLLVHLANALDFPSWFMPYLLFLSLLPPHTYSYNISWSPI